MSAKSIKKALSCILIAAMVTSVCNTTGVTAAKKAVLKTKRLVVEVGSSKKIVIKNKDKKKKYPEAKDPRNWRLRLGYADVILT